MEKCAHCNAEELKKIRLDAMGGVGATLIKENGKSAFLSYAAVYGMLCTKCGTITRLFIDEKRLGKFTNK